VIQPSAKRQHLGFIDKNTGEIAMSEMSDEEQRRILEAPPRGTWALILAIGLAMLVGWLYFFFGLFMSHGPVA